MCIAIYKPKGIAIKRSTLLNCNLNNPDGAGYMYVDEGKLHIKKGYFTFAEFWYDYSRDAEKYRKSPFLIHFRIATSGLLDNTNCHPFRISKTTGFIHNGIFFDLNNISGLLSDTILFRNRFLRDLPEDWMDNTAICNLIENYVKENQSKIVFLNTDMEHWIVGDGYWSRGAWYSNSTYMFRYHFSSYEYTDEEERYLLHQGNNYDHRDKQASPDNERSRVCVYCSETVDRDNIECIDGVGDVCDTCVEFVVHHSEGGLWVP